MCGYSVTNFGHVFPPFVEAAQKQLTQLTHVTGELHSKQLELASSLLSFLGFEQGSHKVIFNSTGARAIESAWKVATAFRPGRVLAFRSGFHGRSLATTALQGESSLQIIDLTGKAVETRCQTEYPYCLRCPLEQQFPACEINCAKPLFHQLERYDKGIAAIIVEPMLGVGGYVAPPDDFFQKLRSVTQKLGILLIADEIQTGLGRCGSKLLSAAQGWEPDLIVLGKSLGGGIAPLSCVIGAAPLLSNLPPGSESETFAASPMACAVGLEVLQQLELGPWLERGRQLGSILRTRLQQLFNNRQSHKTIAITGIGPNAILEFGCDSPLVAASNLRDEQHSTWEATRLAREFATACFRNQLLVHLTGPDRTRVALLPPLNLADEDLEFAMQKIQESTPP